MPEPPRDAGSNDRALWILAEVAGFLSAGLGTEETLLRVSEVLRRSLGAGGCRVWIRAADGAAFRAIVPDDADAPAPIPAEPSGLPAPADGDARIELNYEGERLGFVDLTPPGGPGGAFAIEMVKVVAGVLSPLIASLELSEDLASEVAVRTREIDAQRRFTSKIIDSLPVGLYVIDREYRIQAWNRKRETGTQGVGRKEVIGRTVFEVLHRQPRGLLKAEFDRAFATGHLEQMEVESTATGEPRYYRLTKIPMRLDDDVVTHVITIGEDVTAWKRVQDQVSQTEKLAAVGQLAAGVMHEINNPLATIGACVEALGLRLEDDPPSDAQGFEEYLRIIESELARCKSIVDGLLDFSRPKARFKRPCAVNQVVEDALFLVKHHDKFKGITLRRELAEDLPGIQANTEQLIQVFLSLMLNAIDAMEGKGELTVRTFRREERPDDVVVEFGDTGAGISRDDLPKIFEPFFTTKLPGRGTGLGLSICYGIVQEHGGRIAVESHVGRGSVFQVFLPTGGDGEGP